MVNDIEIGMTLARLQTWVARDSFSVVDRQAKHAQAPNRSLIKLAVRDMLKTDFVRKDVDRDRPAEFVWIFITKYGDYYYIKFKFVTGPIKVKFISFHLARK
ncbi:hypothetical protein [Weissella confusa]|jgi:hypothetical protein|uniref:Type II toxin-antitoxin system MqsR family toxin n=1 Tax=Weissella confusa TaxID=1583 RepID=A0AA40YUQ5_WEICO|nr:hypothetical protein [Weissella confusa]MBJ7616647.1 hypothetical protein [Weissella confusa]MBJ7626692.1 hypothetical protein [Weissella confusa]MBJ7632989.1 hypothetical protein [Weissella confusa]MBJ7639373.1 hypothetical protein [Weissella confusa]MBJ7645803.1 hypothetical protein [Weissella confusa]